MTRLFLAIAVLSAVLSLPRTADRLLYDLRAFVHKDSAEREELLLYSAGLPVTTGMVRLWQREVGPNDRYYVDTATTEIGMPDLKHSLSLYLAFRLLPSILVATPREADVVLSYRRDPRRLGLRFARVVSVGSASAARSRRAR